MALTSIIIAAVLLQYIIFTMIVGWARGKYNIEAPAISGNPMFERFFRVQQNTLELLILFIPGIYMFSLYIRADLAAMLGAVFFISRVMYLMDYTKDPKTRGVSFAISMFSVLCLIIGGLIGAFKNILNFV